MHELASVPLEGVAAGDKFVTGRLETAASTARILAEARLDCTGGVEASGPPTTWPGIRKGWQTARFVWTALADGSWDCRLLARSLIPGDTTVTDGTESLRVVGAGTYVAVAAQPGWAAGTWHPGETLVRRGSAADVGVWPSGLTLRGVGSAVVSTSAGRLYYGGNPDLCMTTQTP